MSENEHEAACVLLKNGRHLTFRSKVPGGAREIVRRWEKSIEGSDEWLLVPEGRIRMSEIAAVYAADMTESDKLDEMLKS